MLVQNKEAEAKEELKRRAKQLEMQRREQQRRAAAGGGGGSGFGGGLGSGMGSYSPVPRYEQPSPQPARTSSPAQSSSLRAPAFKGSGMKLGSKKKTADLLDALGGEALVTHEELSAPPTPSIPVPEPSITASARGSLPAVTREG